MSDSDLGPRPEPKIEPGETNPGGPDSIDQNEERIPADLDPDVNAAIDHEAAPDSLREGEDTTTEATRNGDDVEPEDETPV